MTSKTQPMPVKKMDRQTLDKSSVGAIIWAASQPQIRSRSRVSSPPTQPRNQFLQRLM